MTRYAQAKPQPRSRRWTPIVGLFFALAVAVFAYFISFPLVDFGREQSKTLDEAYFDLCQRYDSYKQCADSAPFAGKPVVEILVAVVLWLILMGLGMLTVAIAIYGTDPERKVLKQMGPSPANKKAVVKQLKKDLKELRRQERELKRQRK